MATYLLRRFKVQATPDVWSTNPKRAKSAPEELVVISGCRDRQELEAELSCGGAHFGSVVCLFIVTMEDGFCVRLLGR